MNGYLKKKTCKQLNQEKLGLQVWHYKDSIYEAPFNLMHVL